MTDCNNGRLNEDGDLSNYPHMFVLHAGIRSGFWITQEGTGVMLPIKDNARMSATRHVYELGNQHF